MFATLSDRLAASSRTCAARAGSPTPTSTPPPARSGSRCSRPTSRCRSSRTSSPRSASGPAASRCRQALNPAQQIVKIVDEELVDILGGETRRLRFAKTPPTVIMLAGLQGSGKTTLAGKLAHWLKGQGHQPVLVAADLQRPNAVTQLQVVGERAGVAGLRARAGQRRRRPGRRRATGDRAREPEDVRRRHRRHRRPPRHRRRADAAGRRHPRRRAARRDRCSSSTR